jgi:multiple sugar transport system substrate-binding protein
MDILGCFYIYLDGMRNKLLTISLLIFLSFALTACTISDLPVIGSLFGGGGVPENKEVTLNVWGLWESPEAMDAMIAKYTAIHPNVTVRYDDRSILNPNDYKDRVLSRVGQEGGPDIVAVHASWVPKMYGTLSPAPEGLLDAEVYAQRFYPSAVETSVSDNKVYAAPFSYDGLALVYNKKHFEEIGQLSSPTSWEEFRSLAGKLTILGEDNSIVRAGAAIGSADNIVFFSDILGLLFSQSGVEFPRDLDSATAKDALTFYTNFVLEDKVWGPEFLEASTAFVNEDVSMVFVPSWALLDILNTRPDLDIGVAPVPQVVSDSPVGWSSYWSYVVPKTSSNSVSAWDFINFLTSEEGQLAMFNEASLYRQYGAPYAVASLGSQLSSHPYLGAYVSSASYGKTNEMAARSGNKKQVEVLKELVNTVLTNALKNTGPTPEEALSVAKSALNSATGNTTE